MAYLVLARASTVYIYVFFSLGRLCLSIIALDEGQTAMLFKLQSVNVCKSSSYSKEPAVKVFQNLLKVLRYLILIQYYLSIPGRWLCMGAVGLHHRSLSAAAGASLCCRVSGVSLLQSYCRENTRLARFTTAQCVRCAQHIQTTDCCSAYMTHGDT